MTIVENVENGSSEERVVGQESPAEECATKRSKYSEVTHWIIKKWILLLGLALLALTLYGLKIIADFIGFAFGPGHLGAETPLRWPNGSVVVNVRQYPTWNNNGTPIPLDIYPRWIDGTLIPPEEIRWWPNGACKNNNTSPPILPLHITSQSSDAIPDLKLFIFWTTFGLWCQY